MNLEERYRNFRDSGIIDKLYYLFLILITGTLFGLHKVYEPITKEGTEFVEQGIFYTNHLWMILFFGALIYFMSKIVISRFNEIRNKVER